MKGDSFARLTGDIANVAKLEVKEGPARFVRYEALATAEHVPQSRPDSLPVSDSYKAGTEIAAEQSRRPTTDLAALPAMPGVHL
jgi:hypothetical protein